MSLNEIINQFHNGREFVKEFIDALYVSRGYTKGADMPQLRESVPTEGVEVSEGPPRVVEILAFYTGVISHPKKACGLLKFTIAALRSGDFDHYIATGGKDYKKE
ncbi:hypothetical protein GOV03_04275 [Candidatus Woesearchaeota archaeon]|nr:hypothetical protein [Candidatus Woesearchaeota archaeon]